MGSRGHQHAAAATRRGDMRQLGSCLAPERETHTQTQKIAKVYKNFKNSPPIQYQEYMILSIYNKNSRHKTPIIQQARCFHLVKA